MTGCSNPVVSVIVPARNEEACLALCLDSLIAQNGIDFEIIVVDDASTDRTPEIARSFATENGKVTASSRADRECQELNGTTGSRVLPDPNLCRRSGDWRRLQLVSAPALPENWTGKNNAMSAGAKIATGKWLLFTDADTVHKPGSLARAVAEAEQHGAALLSYSPEQEVRTFWERAVMPVIFAELATTYPPQAVNDPTSPIAAANGQYLLISREAYDAVGGHTKIAGDLLEDVAVARLVKSSGRRIFFRYGGDAVRTRMYRSWAQMKEGWTKNLALLFPRPLWKAWNVSFYYWMTLGGLALMFTATVLHDKTPLVGLIVMLFPLSAFLRMRMAHFSMLTAAAAVLFGPPVVVYLLLRSNSRNKAGRVTWKGREYLPSPLR